MYANFFFKRIFQALFVILLSVNYSSGQGNAKSSFKWAICPDCPFPNTDTAFLRKVNVEYGYLTVPENRVKDNGHTLRLTFVVLRSLNPVPGSIPLIMIHGGPGGRGIPPDPARQFDMLRKNRDVVLLDQRGSGFSEPEMSPEMNQEIFDLFAKDLTPSAEMEARNAMAVKARDKLVAKGVDLTAYNSAEIAADIHDLCGLLGYKSWDLWGTSYGTRIALTIMKDFPEGIHSVILESPLPPNVPYFQNMTASFRRSLDKLFDKCAADQACRVAYPDLKKDFYAAIDSLDKKPMVISMADRNKFPDGKFVLNSQDMLLGFHQALYGKQIYPVLPLLIEQVKNRNEDALRSFVLNMANGPYRLRYGAYYSIICNDCMPFNSVKAFEDSSAGFWGGLTFYKDEFSICNIWNTGAPNSKDSAAVASNIPVLILSGEMDPIAPPSNGEAAQRTLPHSYLYVFQNTGHFVARDPHAAQLVEEFLKDPSVEPESNHFIQTGDIHFATDMHVHSGIISLAPRLPWNKDNAFYNGWVALILIALLVSLFFVFPGIIARKDKLYYWSMTISAICTIYFIVRLGMIIFRMSTENFFLLGFGLPGRYAWILTLPYVIFLLFIIQAVVLAAGKNGQVKRKQWFLFLLNIPFLLFILRFGLFY